MKSFLTGYRIFFGILTVTFCISWILIDQQADTGYDDPAFVRSVESKAFPEQTLDAETASPELATSRIGFSEQEQPEAAAKEGWDAGQSTRVLGIFPSESNDLKEQDDHQSVRQMLLSDHGMGIEYVGAPIALNQTEEEMDRLAKTVQSANDRGMSTQVLDIIPSSEDEPEQQ